MVGENLPPPHGTSGQEPGRRLEEIAPGMFGGRKAPLTSEELKDIMSCRASWEGQPKDNEGSLEPQSSNVRPEDAAEIQASIREIIEAADEGVIFSEHYPI